MYARQVIGLAVIFDGEFPVEVYAQVQFARALTGTEFMIAPCAPEWRPATLEWCKSDGLDGTSGQREEECMVPGVIVLDVFGCLRSSANSRGGHSQGSHPNGATRDRGQVRSVCTSASRGSMRRGAACGLCLCFMLQGCALVYACSFGVGSGVGKFTSTRFLHEPSAVMTR